MQSWLLHLLSFSNFPTLKHLTDKLGLNGVLNYKMLVQGRREHIRARPTVIASAQPEERGHSRINRTWFQTD